MSGTLVESVKLEGGGLLSFDPVFHLYEIDGQRARGTGSLMEAAEIADHTYCSEEAMFSGGRTHAAIFRDIRGELDLDDSVNSGALTEEEANRVFAARDAIKAMGFSGKKLLPEHLVGVKKWMIATLIDVWIPEELTLIEWKGGAIRPFHKVQTALQYLMLPPCRRFCVYLSPDGKFKETEHKDRESIRVATGLAQANGEAASWIKNHGR